LTFKVDRGFPKPVKFASRLQIGGGLGSYGLAR
jgi:hypothetical protein